MYMILRKGQGHEILLRDTFQNQVWFVREAEAFIVGWTAQNNTPLRTQ